MAVQVDTRRDESNAALAAQAVEAFGGIDIVIPAAGVAHPGYITNDIANNAERQAASAEDPLGHSFIYQPIEMWDYVMDVNLSGVMLTLRHTLRPMIEAGQGGTVVTDRLDPREAAQRGALDSLLGGEGGRLDADQVDGAGNWRSTASASTRSGRASSETSMTAAIRANEESQQAALAAVPMGRMGTPRELANTALFLAGEESSYFTGQLLIPDGGWLPTA